MRLCLSLHESKVTVTSLFVVADNGVINLLCPTDTLKDCLDHHELNLFAEVEVTERIVGKRKSNQEDNDEELSKLKCKKLEVGYELPSTITNRTSITPSSSYPSKIVGEGNDSSPNNEETTTSVSVTIPSSSYSSKIVGEGNDSSPNNEETTTSVSVTTPTSSYPSKIVGEGIDSSPNNEETTTSISVTIPSSSYSDYSPSCTTSSISSSLSPSTTSLQNIITIQVRTIDEPPFTLKVNGYGSLGKKGEKPSLNDS